MPSLVAVVLAAIIVAVMPVPPAHADIMCSVGSTSCPDGYTCSADGTSCTPGKGQQCGRSGGFCPSGSTCLLDGACGVLPKPGQAVPGAFWTGSGWCRMGAVVHDGKYCVEPGEAYCGGGRICPAGTRCKPGGGCRGDIAPGPSCGGARCVAGQVCAKGGTACYDPAKSLDCGNGTACPKIGACRAGGGCTFVVSRTQPLPAIAASRTPTGRGHPDACAHMATSIETAKQAQATLRKNEDSPGNEVRLAMCNLVDATKDELVNISGAHCPSLRSELRALLGALEADKCSPQQRGYYSLCGNGRTEYYWKDEQGNMKVGRCGSGGGGVRG